MSGPGAIRCATTIRIALDDNYKMDCSTLGTEAVHFFPVRVILCEEAFLEKQELVFSSVSVVQDSDEETLEVDLYAVKLFSISAWILEGSKNF